MNTKKGNILLFVISIALGLFLMVQYQTSKNILNSNKSPIENLTDLNEAMINMSEEKNNLKEQINSLNAQIKEYEVSAEKSKAEYDKVYEELEKQKILSGYYDVEGPGAIITITSDSNVVANMNSQLLSLVNYLNSAGSEAISINGQRYTNYTEIIPVSDHIIVNNVPFVLPLEIKAIGNKRTIESVLSFVGGVVVTQIEVAGFNVSVEYADNIQINKFDGEKTLKYAQPLGLNE